MDGVLTSGEIQPISGVCAELKTRSLTRSPPSKPLGIKPKNSQIDKWFKKTVTSDQTNLASANSGEFQLPTFMNFLFFQHNVLTKFSCRIFQCIKKGKHLSAYCSVCFLHYFSFHSCEFHEYFIYSLIYFFDIAFFDKIFRP